MQIYCFYDVVSEEYLPLWLARTDKQALKMVQKAAFAEKEKDRINLNELRLFCLGDFNSETGEIFYKRRELQILVAEDCE